MKLATCECPGGTNAECDDGDACTLSVCDPATNVCAQGDVVCNDNDPCTIDFCDSALGCLLEPVVCDDNQKCTADSCNAVTGICEFEALNCDDLNACTTDLCEPSIGCVNTGGDCDDKDVCTTDSCDKVAGCSNEPAIDCGDGKLCTVDSCHGVPNAAGDLIATCANTPVDCDDSNACTNDTCKAEDGQCQNEGIVCDDNSQCTLDSCAPATGCVFANKCDDSNPCTVDACEEASLGCSHTPTDCTDFVDGNDPNLCTDDTCDPASGCVNTDKDCSDGNACTVDSCSIVADGQGVKGAQCETAPVDCNDNSVCTVDLCDPATGCTNNKINCADGVYCSQDQCHFLTGCFNTPIQNCPPNGPVGCKTAADCDDKSACTTDACIGGGCKNIVISCTDGNPCTLDQCNPIAGCQFPDKDCADDDICTEDTCAGNGNCVHVQKTCNDGDPCTNDTCNQITDCTFVYGCEDNNECTFDICNPSEGCQNFSQDCSDGNACTTDTCDPATGACTYSAIDCNDDNPCTVEEDESGTSLCDEEDGCVYLKRDCDDSSKCTTDLCDPQTVDGCGYTATCADPNAGTTDGGEEITRGAHGTVTCDDSNPCTIDSCNPETGCVFVTKTCDDGNACSEDSCDPVTGFCVQKPLDCDDTSACSVDVCDPKVGCINSPVSCDDSDACTTDGCVADSGCFHAPINCNDGNDCTIDGCNPGVGCTNTPKICTDSSPCTEDTCTPATGCLNLPKDCTDYDSTGAEKVCTIDSCHESLGCIHTLIPNTVCSCEQDSECDDSDSCTNDVCVNSPTGKVCKYNPKACEDGDPCTLGFCANGDCQQVANPCDDTNACTADSCDPAAGGCQHAVIAECVYNCKVDSDCSLAIEGQACSVANCDLGQPHPTVPGEFSCVTGPKFDPAAGINLCEDGSPCTIDSCDPAKGGCVQEVKSCDDDDECTIDSCSNLDGTCTNLGVICNDDDPCTTDTCVTGEGCVGNPIDCSDGDVCTVDICNPGTGACESTGLACSDGLPCTADACNPETGECEFAAKSCDDGNNCTLNYCNPQTGECVDTIKTCDDINPCTIDSCDQGTGDCVFDGLQCSDGNKCTQDTCNAEGKCENTPINCDDGDECTIEFCDATTGGCKAVVKDCDDQNVCTTDACNSTSGDCEYTAKTCSDNNQCTADSCNPLTGACTNVKKACDDGNDCTDDYCNPLLASNEGCVNVAIAPQQCGEACQNNGECDDNNGCTADLCLFGKCVIAPMDCDDGICCTIDGCDPNTLECRYDKIPGCAEKCFGDDSLCDDQDPCTTDSCHPDSDVCIWDPDPDCVTCNSDLDCLPQFHPAAIQTGVLNFCAVGNCDKPAPGDQGKCVWSPKVCHDANICTFDQCIPTDGCQFRTAGDLDGDGQIDCDTGCDEDTDCDDDNLCTVDACELETNNCFFLPVDCNDSDACTQDYCHPSDGGCNNVADAECAGLGQDCKVEADCDIGDKCVFAACAPLDTGAVCQYEPRNCNDYNSCTTDSCDPATGCFYEKADDSCDPPKCAATSDCNDDNACTSDACVFGKCIYEPVDDCPKVYCSLDSECIDDLNCTRDECLPIGECQHNQVICQSDKGCQFFNGECIEGYGCEFNTNFDCSAPCVSDADCDSADLCYASKCGAGGVCEIQLIDAIPPDDEDAVYPTYCTDFDDCTYDVCNPLTGKCTYIPDPACVGTCKTNDDCPDLGIASCAPPKCAAGACTQNVIPCQDFNPCTADSCNGATETCQYIPIEGCVGCAADEECDDGDACTDDTCDGGNCEFDSKQNCLPCANNGDCVPPEPCQYGVCDQGSKKCKYLEIPDCVGCDPALPSNLIKEACDDGIDCTIDTCNEAYQFCEYKIDVTLSGCGATGPCTTNNLCGDLDPCTLDFCDFDAVDEEGNTVPACSNQPATETNIAECPLACIGDMDCFDDDACTVDRCDPASLTCFWEKVDCVDGLACTTDHTCNASDGCDFAPIVNCSEACTVDADCDTKAPCLVGVCDAGVCTIQQKACNDGLPDTQDFCDAYTGECGVVAKPGWTGCSNDQDCENGNECLEHLCAANGSCIYVAKVCDDNANCTVDACDEITGCKFSAIAGCNKGCELLDGESQADADAKCDDSDSCTVDTCNTDNGFCTNVYDLNCGKTSCTKDIDCTDSNACTWERCVDGFCQTNPVLCQDGKSCTIQSAETGDVEEEGGVGAPDCDQSTGCNLLPDVECAAVCATDKDCDTGYPCVPGKCTAGNVCEITPVVCPGDGNNLTLEYCDDSDGTCKSLPVTEPVVSPCTDEVHCDDGDACNDNDCTGGVCVYATVQCNDSDPCTIDSCDPASGCVFTAIPDCQGCSKDSDCETFSLCHTDKCNTATAQCQHIAVPGCKACEQLTVAVDCEDGDTSGKNGEDCTLDLCDKDGKCFYLPVKSPECNYVECQNDVQCSDNAFCTTNRCNNGLCEHTKIECIDDNPCTQNGSAFCTEEIPFCNPHLDLTCGGITCATDDDCPVNDANACYTGSCTPLGQCTIALTKCDDGDPKTIDFCDPTSGECVFKNFPAGNYAGCVDTPEGDPVCDDGDLCTSEDCEEGQCVYIINKCNDFDVCTIDTCDPVDGCIFTQQDPCPGCDVDADCDDGNYCTDDFCGTNGATPINCINIPKAPGSDPICD